MLLQEFLIPMGLSQQDLANAIRVPYQRVNELVNGRRGMTPSTALRLERFFGMQASFWLNLQLRWDLYFTQEKEKNELDVIEPYRVIRQIDATDELRRAEQALVATGLVTPPGVSPDRVHVSNVRLAETAERYAVGEPLSDLVTAERDER